jgi:hypothetical protein
VTDERLEEIRMLMIRAEARLSTERAYALRAACRQLLAEVERLRALVPTQGRLV